MAVTRYFFKSCTISVINGQEVRYQLETGGDGVWTLMVWLMQGDLYWKGTMAAGTTFTNLATAEGTYDRVSGINGRSHWAIDFACPDTSSASSPSSYSSVSSISSWSTPSSHSSTSSSSNACTEITFADARSATPQLLGTFAAGDYSLTYVTGAYSLSGSSWWVGGFLLFDGDSNQLLDAGPLGPSTVYTTQADSEAGWAGTNTTLTLTASTDLHISASDGLFGDNTSGTPNPIWRMCFLGDNSSSSVVPDNNTCTTAIAIAAMPFSDQSALQSLGERRWYKFTPSSNCTVTIQTCAMNNFDSYLRVYSDCGITQIAEDDDGCGDTSSIITADVAAGQTYWISVGAYDDEYTGLFQLDVSGC